MKANYNHFFSIILLGLAAVIVHPTTFSMANRIEPWVLGLPFVMFWVMLIAVVMCCIMMLWYYFDIKSGAVDIDIEHATKEEMAGWKNNRGTFK